jgi:hypothetical protein
MNSAMEALGGDIVKRYRLYQKPLTVSQSDTAAAQHEDAVDELSNTETL